MNWWLADLSPREMGWKLIHRVAPNVRHLPRSRIRVCGACQSLTVFVALGADPEFHLCIRCRANQRYELLARHLRATFPDIRQLDILELDDRSPLRRYLVEAHTYARSYYRDNISPGEKRPDGVVCQDITRLTYPDASLDLIVSSDVLEHVPDVSAAFRETARVLRPGGAHLFTVPPRPVTKQRAKLESGRVIHLTEPDYHRDPLNPAGVLAFWDFGPDFPAKFGAEGLTIRAGLAPYGMSGRVVWEARRT